LKRCGGSWKKKQEKESEWLKELRMHLRPKGLEIIKFKSLDGDHLKDIHRIKIERLASWSEIATKIYKML